MPPGRVPSASDNDDDRQACREEADAHSCDGLGQASGIPKIRLETSFGESNMRSNTEYNGLG